MKLAQQMVASGVKASLQTLRLQKGLTQVEVSTNAGITQPHLARIEAGSVKMTLETAGKLADALEVSLDDIRQLVMLSNEESILKDAIV